MRKVRDLLKDVAEEANYPGRPQPHMAARNPLWGGEPDQPRPGTPAPKPTPQSSGPPSGAVDPFAQSPSSGRETGDEYWFLKDNEEEDGWRETNPGKTDPAEDD